MFKQISIREHIPVKGLSSFKVGGYAKYFAVVNSPEDIQPVLDFSAQSGAYPLVIGGGTNTLFSDEELNVCIIRLSGEFSRHSLEGNNIIAGAGANLGAIVKKYAHIQPGLNIFSGLPGTIGGAIKGNAGIKIKDRAFGILNSVKRVYCFISNREQEIPIEQIKFGYRWSSVPWIITRAVIDLDKFEEFENTIIERPPIEPFPNIGCVFKNTEDYSAGWLIDQCGLKGKRIGGATISNIHANFILNIDNATYADIMALIDLARSSVKEKFNIDLTLEIKVVSNESLRINGGSL